VNDVVEQWPVKVLQRKYKALLKRALQLADESVAAKATVVRLLRERNALADRVLRLEHNIAIADDVVDNPTSTTSATTANSESLREQLRPLRALRQYALTVAAHGAAHDAHHADGLDGAGAAATAAAATGSGASAIDAASGASAEHAGASSSTTLAATNASATGGGDFDDAGDDGDDDAGEYAASSSRSAYDAGASSGASAPKKRKRKSESTHEPVLCTYVSDMRPCKSRAQIGSKFCYHHQPMDPNSGYVTCEFTGKKKCNLPVRKEAPQPRLCKRHEPKLVQAPPADAGAATTDAQQ
jgi:hypothetical protein